MITALAVVAVIILAVFLLINRKQETPEATAKCIGQNSILYVQLGCHACERQENLFIGSYQHLNVVDCFYDGSKCAVAGISATPTWIINGKKYVGMQSVERLKELTGC